MTATRVVWKMQHFDLTEEQAAELVAAGYDSPQKVKAATDGDLKKVKGVDNALVSKLRTRLGRK